MEELGQAFEERLKEIECYLDFLDGVEAAARSGPPRIGNNGALITAKQQHILYSSIFLQLYNLVEATIVRCLDAITENAITSGGWIPSDLTEDLRREWVRVMARTHTDLNYENRLNSALTLCEHLVSALPISAFKVEKGGGGNWNDSEIESIAIRLGFQLRVSTEVYSNVKRRFRDDLGALAYVTKLRNSLAHGSISFAECGSELTVGDLHSIVEITSQYMREVVEAFSNYIERREFVIPSKRRMGDAL